MLRLLADENVPKRLVKALKDLGIDVVRLQDLGLRGISDKEVISLAKDLERTILTRDVDFSKAHLLRIAEFGVIYIAYQPKKEEIPDVAARIAKVSKALKPKRGLLIIIKRNSIDVYG